MLRHTEMIFTILHIRYFLMHVLILASTCRIGRLPLGSIEGVDGARHPFVFRVKNGVLECF